MCLSVKSPGRWSCVSTRTRCLALNCAIPESRSSDFRSHPVKPEAQHLIAKMHFSLCGSAILKSCSHPRREITEAVTKRFRPDPLLGWPYFRSASCSCFGDPVALVFGTCPPPAGGDHWQPAPTQREPGSLPGWYFDILTVNTPSRWHSVQLVRDVKEVPQKECRKNNLMRGMTANPEKRREKTRRPALFLLHPLAPSLWPPQYVLVLLKVGR